jgi:hypothetical protein
MECGRTALPGKYAPFATSIRTGHTMGKIDQNQTPLPMLNIET